MISFDTTARSLSLDAGRFSATRGQITLQTDRTTESLREGSEVGQDGGWTFYNMGQMRLRLKVEASRSLWLEIENVGQRNLDLQSASVSFAPETFHCPLEAMEHCQLVHSRDFCCLSGVKPIHVPATWETANPDSSLVTVYSHDQSGQALLVGALPPFGAGFTAIRTLHAQPHLQGAFGFEVRFDFRQRLAPGMTTRAAGLIFETGLPGEELLEQYGRMLGERLSVKPKPRVTGWNSWDYYMGAVQRRHLDENLAAYRDRLGQPAGTIIIDEGWERAWGVWEPNWKFPEGIADFCSSVCQAGFVPGIWTAPLMCGIFTPIYFDHPDWMARDAAGNVHLETLPYGQMAILDITHPEVREHLRAVYRRLCEAGVVYFKCDFTQMALGAVRFHDPAIGRNQVIRLLFELVREVIGPDRYLLACGAPFESVLGIVDANRVANDVRTYWCHIRNIVRALAARSWMGMATTLDADFLVVRCAQTSDSHRHNPLWPQSPEQLGMTWMTGREMCLEEAKVMALAVCLAGGDVVLGDALDQLNSTGLSLLKTCLEADLPPARVLNLFTPGQEETPILVSRSAGQTVVGFFNLTEAPQMLNLGASLECAATGGLDFWTGQPVDFDPRQPFLLPPRSARGIRFRIAE